MKPWLPRASLVALAIATLRCSSSDSGAAQPQDTSADFEAYLSQLPSSICQHYLRCGRITEDKLADCEQDLNEEKTSLSCNAMNAFFDDHRSELEACLDGSQGTCASDDLKYYCPAYDLIDTDKICSTPTTDAGTPPDAAVQLTLQQLAVGGWSASGSCGGTNIKVGWFLCPGGRLRGGTTLETTGFVDCGTWQVSADQVQTSYDSVAVQDSSNRDHYDVNLAYDPVADTLTWQANCPVKLQRVAGSITEADCASNACTAGGTGSVQCSTDCDCGRCWYCEDGICRYGGEGPYTCYRGCGF